MKWDNFFNWMMDREGRLITSDPHDPGGQTAWGIARKYHPDWPGWKMVDAGITSGPVFEKAVSDFYMGFLGPYWNTMPERVREAFCDALCNMGPGKRGDKDLGAVEILQVALNRLAGHEYVEVDGNLGPNTRAAIKNLDPNGLAMTMCLMRIEEYRARVERDPRKSRYLAGWLNRVSLLARII